LLARHRQGPYGYEHVNAAKQRRDPNSMLNWTERIIRMRKEVPEVGWGDFKNHRRARSGDLYHPL
jgi:glycosidase